jgi:dipeptidyl aminopeptidase/acylaminoacyl peptidase
MTVESNVEYVAGKNRQNPSLLYMRGGSLFQQPFDGERWNGQAVRLGENIRIASDSVHGIFDAAVNGDNLIFDSSPSTSLLTWFDRAGKPLSTAGQAGNYMMVRLSPDGSRLAVAQASQGPGNYGIWSLEMARGVASRLTISPATDWFPVWSPDGQQIVFSSDRRGKAFTELFEKSSMEPGAGEAPLPGLPDSDLNPTDWSKDGRWIVAFSSQEKQEGIFVVPSSGDQKPVPFLKTPFHPRFPRISPDNRWIAYSSTETGRKEVFASPFEGWQAGRPAKVQLSIGGGDYPVWSPDGKQLYYLAGGLTLYSVPTHNLEGGVSHPTELFKVCSGKPAEFSNGLVAWPYDVSPQGDRFLVMCPTEHTFVVLLNWMR